MTHRRVRPSQLPLRQVGSLLRSALYVSDASGFVTYCNERAVELWNRRPRLGVDTDRTLWRSFQLFRTDGSRLPYDETPMARALRVGEPVQDEQLMMARPGQSPVVVEVNVDPIYDKHGVIGTVNTFHDITERKRLEDALSEAKTQLGEAQAVKDEFLGLVSHELRTPVTTILGNARLIERIGSSLDEVTRKEMLADVCREAARLYRIVEDLLALVRLEWGRLECQPVVLSHVVAQVVHEYRRSSDHVIRLEGAERAGIVLGDESAVSQVLRNYLSNANKYSPGVAAEIMVIIEDTEEEVRVRVLDRGVGVKSEEIESLFDPFYRSKTAADTRSGIGIGLSVCRRLMEAIGGRVWGSPREGGGSEFGFALPLYDETSEEPSRG